jgi:hypothetical protein
MSQKVTFYGWYSQQADDRKGGTWADTVDGNRVRVTHTSMTARHMTGDIDSTLVGILTTYVVVPTQDRTQG